MEAFKTYELGDQLLVDPLVLFLENSLGWKTPIALRLVIVPKEHLAGWHDTIHDHKVKYKSFTVEENLITLIGEDHSVWKFRPLTLELFAKVKGALVPIGQNFNSDEELRAFYAESRF